MPKFYPFLKSKTRHIGDTYTDTYIVFIVSFRDIIKVPYEYA